MLGDWGHFYSMFWTCLRLLVGNRKCQSSLPSFTRCQCYNFKSGMRKTPCDGAHKEEFFIRTKGLGESGEKGRGQPLGTGVTKKKRELGRGQHEWGERNRVTGRETEIESGGHKGLPACLFRVARGRRER